MRPVVAGLVAGAADHGAVDVALDPAAQARGVEPGDRQVGVAEEASEVRHVSGTHRQEHRGQSPSGSLSSELQSPSDSSVRLPFSVDTTIEPLRPTIS